MNSVIDLILCLFFPKKALTRKIEKMSPNEFINMARKSDIELPASFPVYSLFSYKDPIVRQAIFEVKYMKNKKIAELFSKILKSCIISELDDEMQYTHFIDPIIIPIPSHKKKIKAKGFNQTEFILEGLGKISSSEILPALIKIKKTPDQTYKKREDRLKNLKGCFEVRESMKNKIKGRNIIIFDDVATTGGTLIEAERVLKKAKARRIVGFTLAH